jgi:hypothetical protein
MKKLFNFYVETSVLREVQEKLVRLSGDTPKGQVASLIRVLLNQFLHTPDDKVNPLLIEAISAEYQYTQLKNKRSNL